MSKSKHAALAAVITIASFGAMASSASALTFKSENSGLALADGTTVVGSVAAGTGKLTNATTGATVATCSGGTIQGTVQDNTTGSPYLAGNSISLTGCLVAGSPVTVTTNASVSNTWNVAPSGASSPFTGNVLNPTAMAATVSCGTGVTYTPLGTPTGFTFVNDTSGAGTTGGKGYLLATNLGTLRRTALGTCPALPQDTKLSGRLDTVSVAGNTLDDLQVG
jgi:hypothetical protein